MKTRVNFKHPVTDCRLPKNPKLHRHRNKITKRAATSNICSKRKYLSFWIAGSKKLLAFQYTIATLFLSLASPNGSLR